MSAVRLMLSFAIALAIAPPAFAQVLGTFRWRTEPFCNVLTLTVAQQGGIFTLDGFDQPCGGGARMPVHGVAVVQANGSITLGLSVVMLPGGPPVNLEAGVGGDFSGAWRDSAGNSGAFIFSPASTSGGPRGGPIEPAPLPSTFIHTPNGNFVILSGPQADVLPVNGIGSRMMWFAAKSAFRAGRAEGPEWDAVNIGTYSAAFGVRPRASGTASFAAGIDVSAAGVGGIALGSSAVSAGDGSFAFGDRSSANLITSAANEFNVRASGGFGFYTNPGLTAGIELHANTSQWFFLSDVNSKEHFRDLDGDELLAKFARLPVQEWSYKTQGAGIRHVGPTAQDFRAAFGLGEDPLRIGSLDADGIALAGVKALEARTRSLTQANDQLMRDNEALRLELNALRERLDRLEARR